MKLKSQMLFVLISVMLFFLIGCTGNRKADNDVQKQFFSLRTNFNEFADDEIDSSLFNEIINSFIPDVWDFLVLSPETPIQDSTFIQVGAPQENVGFQYTLEIGFETKESGLTLYRLYTKDKDIVLQYILDYWQEQKIPDILLWEDVSWEMKPQEPGTNQYLGIRPSWVC